MKFFLYLFHNYRISPIVEQWFISLISEMRSILTNYYTYVDLFQRWICLSNRFTRKQLFSLSFCLSDVDMNPCNKVDFSHQIHTVSTFSKLHLRLVVLVDFTTYQPFLGYEMPKYVFHYT